MPEASGSQKEDKVAFISGPIQTPAGYFQLHYVPKLDKAITSGHSFVVGPAPGMDTESLRYLIAAGVEPDKITVYMARFEEKLLAVGLQWFMDLGVDIYIEGASTEARDAAMTRDSDYDILRYMTVEEQKNLYGQNYYPRISQTGKNERRRQKFAREASELDSPPEVASGTDNFQVLNNAGLP